MELLTEIAKGLWGLSFKVFIIVVPLIALMEWARAQPWFDRVIAQAGKVFEPVGFRPSAILSLLTGVVFGISYGAGILIPQSQSGQMNPRQVFLVAAFLSLCHAIFEDTLLFVALLARINWPRLQEQAA